MTKNNDLIYKLFALVNIVPNTIEFSAALAARFAAHGRLNTLRGASSPPPCHKPNRDGYISRYRSFFITALRIILPTLLLSGCYSVPHPDEVVMISRPLGKTRPPQAAKLPPIGEASTRETLPSHPKLAHIALQHPTALNNHHVTTSVQHPMILTLTDAIALAVRHNLALQSDKLSRIVEKYNLILAQYDFDPQFSLQGNYTYSRNASDGFTSASRSASLNPVMRLQNHYGTTFQFTQTNRLTYHRPNHLDPFGPTNGSQGLTTEITQNLLKGFGREVVDAALNNAKDNERINQLNFTASVNSTITTVINNYFSLIQAYQSLEIDQKSLAIYAQQMRIDRLKIQAGQIPESNLINSKSNYASLEVTIENDKNTISNARRILLNSIGLESYTPFTLPEFKKELAQDQQILSAQRNMLDRQKSFQYALSHNINYQTAGITILTLQRNVAVTKNNALPTLDFALTHSFDFSNIHNTDDNSNLQASLTYNQPINDVTLKSATVSAEVALQQAILNLKQARRDLYSTVNNDIDTIKSLETQINLGETAVTLQETNYNIARQKYDHGLASNYEVSTEEQQLNDQRIALISARINYLRSLTTFAQDLNMTLELWHIRVVAGDAFVETIKRLNDETIQHD